MTGSSIIQQARDVLAKWRGHPLTGNWSMIALPLTAGGGVPYSFDIVDDSAVYAANADDESAARLIVGTAGNPDLLDALDEPLRAFANRPERAIPVYLLRIAAAIIAADERMTS